MTSRVYASRRKRIVDALVDKLKTIDGQGAFLTDVGANVHPRMKFWDEIDEFPAIHLMQGVRPENTKPPEYGIDSYQ
mgnify:CR=1 FL=1